MKSHIFLLVFAFSYLNEKRLQFRIRNQTLMYIDCVFGLESKILDNTLQNERLQQTDNNKLASIFKHLDHIAKIFVFNFLYILFMILRQHCIKCSFVQNKIIIIDVFLWDLLQKITNYVLHFYR